jgi:hypothetical protein
MATTAAAATVIDTFSAFRAWLDYRPKEAVRAA